VYYSDPVSDVVECFLVEEQVLEPCQRAILVHSTTLLEHVAVAFEVVARRTYVTQCQTTNEQPSTQQVRILQITQAHTHARTHTHTHTRLTALCPGLPGWAGTRKVKTNLDFPEARDSEWQWHQLGHMQVCTSLQADNHANTPLLSLIQAGCPSYCPTNSVEALKAVRISQ